MQPSSRPFYESAADRRNEVAVIEKVAASMRLKAAKLKPSLGLDFALLLGNKVVAFAEVKVRSYTWDELHLAGGYMLSLDKWLRARTMCDGLPFVLAVEAKGDLRVYRVEDFKSFPINVGGRKDRGDWQDLEPCVFIPVSYFNALENSRHAA